MHHQQSQLYIISICRHVSLNGDQMERYPIELWSSHYPMCVGWGGFFICFLKMYLFIIVQVLKHGLCLNFFFSCSVGTFPTCAPFVLSATILGVI